MGSVRWALCGGSSKRSWEQWLAAASGTGVLNLPRGEPRVRRVRKPADTGEIRERPPDWGALRNLTARGWGAVRERRCSAPEVAALRSGGAAALGRVARQARLSAAAQRHSR